MEWLHRIPPLSILAGVFHLAAHIVLALLFRFVFPRGPWTDLPNATAHQVVCLPLMIYLVVEGGRAWYTEQDELFDMGFEGRIFGVSKRGEEISQIVFGMMLFWDIPLSVVVPSLQDNVMLLHHIGMCFVSAVSFGYFSSGHPIGSYYASFFYGVIEFSSVFLAVVDLFHPRNRAWFDWINDSETASTAKSLAKTVNELARVIFAVSYLVIRCAMFPYVIFSTCLFDFWEASLLSDEERYGISRVNLWLICALNFGFTLMQLNWGVLVLKQIMKALGFTSSKDKKKTD